MPMMSRLFRIFNRDAVSDGDLASLEARIGILEAKLAQSGIGAQQVITAGSAVGLRRGSFYLNGTNSAPPATNVTLANHPESWVIEKF